MIRMFLLIIVSLDYYVTEEDVVGHCPTQEDVTICGKENIGKTPFMY